ncbi:MAG TPA: RluA family pseudouridine synthase [Bacteroidia bacterium]|jgi:23S rRNA pseudouridine1911/1915/1917 synthase|nr:RluA family pseudouridine synthase [Bacteroidia bacterium]
MQLEVLYEDNHIIAVNKRASDIVQGDKTGDTPLSEFVKQYLKEKYNKPGDVFVGTVHRIDRPVSGIVLFAKTSKALARLNQMFQTKEIQKTYWAIVKNKPAQKSGKLVHYLKKNEAKNMSRAFEKETQGALRSELNYEVISHSDNYFLLEINPLTGRHHQIRVQLSAMGSPIKGDLKYGFERSNKDASIHLHARKIAFVHPVKKEPVIITAPVPNEQLWKVFEKMI